MLENLKNPPEPFADIIRTHFRLKARSLEAQLDKWLAEDNGHPLISHGTSAEKPISASGANEAAASVRATADLKANIDQLKELLKRLERGEDLDEPVAQS